MFSYDLIIDWKGKYKTIDEQFLGNTYIRNSASKAMISIEQVKLTI